MDISLAPDLAYRFMLVFARVGVLVMLLPGFGQNGIPTRIRLAFALLLTLLMVPLVELPGFAVETWPVGALVPMIKEVLIGLFIGLTVRMILMATSVAGSTIANQMGLGLAQSVDPTQGIQGALFANFLGVLAVTLVFVTDMHHVVIAAIHDSYILFKPGIIPPTSDMAMMAVMSMSDAFSLGVRMAAPFLVFGLIFYVGVGVLSRLMPAIQIFFIAMPASILLGFVLLALLLSTMMAVYHEYFATLLGRFLAQ
ncbi:MAG: flagellar biosynthetic protein FliR [Alphaproteobacteria bacterium]